MLTLFLTGCADLGIPNPNNNENNYENDLVTHFIDVGQGDSSLIEFPNGQVALIDGGPRSNSKELIKYLKSTNINKIDYLIATHPHEDHIGGLPEVLRNFKVENIYMPDRIASTKIFEDLLKEIERQNLSIDIAESGDYIIDDGDLKFYFLGPVRNNYEKTNNYSIVSKIEYKDNSVLITGDAEKESEKDMLDKNLNVKSEVLRVGHHGSRTSSTKDFIKKVSADYYIISLGKDNEYNHPHKEVMATLDSTSRPVYRTDELGTIVMVADGTRIEFKDIDKLEEDKTLNLKEEKGTYIGNVNTKTYHKETCSYLPKEENRIYFESKEEAEKNGYEAHSNCVN